MHATGPGDDSDAPMRDRLVDLRRRADQDFLAPSGLPTPGRHRIDLPELQLRVSLTRARYPNRPEGREMYAVTLSRTGLDHAPADPEVRAVLEVAFGDLASEAAERTGGGPLIRMFRVPVGGAAHPS